MVIAQKEKYTGQKAKEQVASRTSTEGNKERNRLSAETKNEVYW